MILVQLKIAFIDYFHMLIVLVELPTTYIDEELAPVFRPALTDDKKVWSHEW